MEHSTDTGPLAAVREHEPRPAATVTTVRGVRGATTALSNTSEDILEATDEMMRMLIALNDLKPEDVASAIFTTTPDLNATFPALAAREIGWLEVPLMCGHEMSVTGSLQKAVRVMLHINTTRLASEIRHVYLKGARQLRPEWAYSDEQVDAVLASTVRA
ncbi:MAG: chorismate mutase [Thermomicrobiales bacterium]